MNLLRKTTAFLLSHFDKVLHFAAGTMLATLSVMVFHAEFSHRAALMISVIVSTVLLAGYEVYQHYSPPQDWDLWDFVWGMAGAVPVWLAFYNGGAL